MSLGVRGRDHKCIHRFAGRLEGLLLSKATFPHSSEVFIRGDERLDDRYDERAQGDEGVWSRMEH
jgi:hypothetical protein